MDIIKLMGLCMFLLVGCENDVDTCTYDSGDWCFDGQGKYIGNTSPEFDNTTITETIIQNITDIDINRTNIIFSNYSAPAYEPTLNMSNLRYNGEEVVWVYQIEKESEHYMFKRIVSCIKLENESRYCTE